MAAKEEKIGAVASKSAPDVLTGRFLSGIITHLSSKVFHPFWGILTIILFPRMQELQDHASTDCGWPQTSVYATSTLQHRVVVAMTTSMLYILNMPWVLHTSTLHYTTLYVPILCRSRSLLPWPLPSHSYCTVQCSVTALSPIPCTFILPNNNTVVWQFKVLTTTYITSCQF